LKVSQNHLEVQLRNVVEQQEMALRNAQIQLEKMATENGALSDRLKNLESVSQQYKTGN
jgi:hypothetical protein